MPKVSVVIPAYNSMAYLPETVDSVFQQTFTDFEVLIVDDGSSDGVQQWATGLVDPRVKFISQANQGVSVARNTGIAQAQGEYIALLDSDDLWEPTKLDKQVRCLDDNPQVGLVHSWIAFIDEHSQPTGRLLISSAEGDVWQQLVERNLIPCCSVMARRCCFETTRGFDPNLRSAEDWDLWIRIAAHYPFALIKQPLAYYRLLPTSKSKNCQLVEKSLTQIIEKTFQSAPSELLYLKNRSYGYANLNLAWKSLQTVDSDYRQSNRYRQQALVYYPQLRFSRDNIRLSFAIALMQFFGVEGYSRLLELAYSLRRRLSSVAR
ncbi:MAG: glycosyltransferase [Symploca sp. SIO3E6]|nr:glycosyltransferase [Caldora sp. SIO3E6]